MFNQLNLIYFKLARAVREQQTIFGKGSGVIE